MSADRIVHCPPDCSCRGGQAALPLSPDQPGYDEGIARALDLAVSAPTPAYEPYDGKHPCIAPGCEHTVLFDDEPWCYTHSPDSGSSIRGYSYKAAQALSDAWERDARDYA